MKRPKQNEHFTFEIVELLRKDAKMKALLVDGPARSLAPCVQFWLSKKGIKINQEQACDAIVKFRRWSEGEKLFNKYRAPLTA